MKKVAIRQKPSKPSPIKRTLRVDRRETLLSPEQGVEVKTLIKMLQSLPENAGWEDWKKRKSIISNLLEKFKGE
jgi:hypothetical protein